MAVVVPADLIRDDDIDDLEQKSGDMMKDWLIYTLILENYFAVFESGVRYPINTVCLDFRGIGQAKLANGGRFYCPSSL